MVVGAGTALLLVVAVVAVLGLRDSGGQRTASPGTTAPFAPGTGGGAPGGGGVPGGGGGTAPGGGTLGAGSLRLPDQVDGLPRMPLGDRSLLESQQELLDMITGTGALDGWGIAAYGADPDDPRFVLLVVKARDAASTGAIADAVVDAIRNSLGGDLSEPRTITLDGVDYQCSGASLGSLCSYQDGAIVGLGFSRDGDLDRLSQLTDEARRGVRG